MSDPIIPRPGDDSSPVAGDRFGGRFEVKDGVRRHVARGTIINAAFLVGLSSLGFLKGFLVAAFLTAEDYGLWGILVISVGTLAWLAQTGIGAKYIQQDEEDQELAFQKAFTLQLTFNGVFTAVLMLLVPLIAVVYGREELLVPGLILCLVFPGLVVLGAHLGLLPADEVRTAAAAAGGRTRRRVLPDPGAGDRRRRLLEPDRRDCWWACGPGPRSRCACSPYPLRLRFDRATLREYASFSWPVMLYGMSGLVIAQVSVLILNWKVSLAVIGAVALTTTITNFTDGWTAS